MKALTKPDRIMRLPEVLAAAGVRRSALYKMIRMGRFPSPIKLGADKIAAGWLESEVVEWQRKRIAERDRARERIMAHGDAQQSTPAHGGSHVRKHH